MSNKTAEQRRFSLIDDRRISAVPNESVKWRLQTADGKYFGDVSYNAYKAIENNTLDKYTPVNDSEKKAIDRYKAHTDNLMVDFKLSDGTNLGKISKSGLDAISNDKIHTYTPKNDEEKATIEQYKNISNYVHPDNRVTGDSFGAHAQHAGDQAGLVLISNAKSRTNAFDIALVIPFQTLFSDHPA